MEVQDWLAATTASAIMTQDVITLRPDEKLASAAARMTEAQVSGAPVVDEEQRCVGVLSVNDFLGAGVKVAGEQNEVAHSPFFSSGLVLPMGVYEQELIKVRDKLAPVAEHPVREFMTTDLVSVEQGTPVATIIQYLVDAHIHRVVVLDAASKLVGLVSSTDILAALQRENRNE